MKNIKHLLKIQLSPNAFLEQKLIQDPVLFLGKEGSSYSISEKQAFASKQTERFKEQPRKPMNRLLRWPRLAEELKNQAW